MVLSQMQNLRQHQKFDMGIVRFNVTDPLFVWHTVFVRTLDPRGILWYNNLYTACKKGNNDLGRSNESE